MTIYLPIWMKKKMWMGYRRVKAMDETKYVGVSEIQRNYLPISKKAIRKMLTKNFHVLRNGNRILVDRKQLLDYLDKVEK